MRSAAETERKIKAIKEAIKDGSNDNEDDSSSQGGPHIEQILDHRQHKRATQILAKIGQGQVEWISEEEARRSSPAIVEAYFESMREDQEQ